jgi:hypothetical protein
MVTFVKGGGPVHSHGKDLRTKPFGFIIRVIKRTKTASATHLQQSGGNKTGFFSLLVTKDWNLSRS